MKDFEERLTHCSRTIRIKNVKVETVEKQSDGSEIIYLAVPAVAMSPDEHEMLDRIFPNTISLIDKALHLELLTKIVS